MKKIAYTVVDNGVDGKAKTIIINAFWSEISRDLFIENSPNKNYWTKAEQIIDVEKAGKEAYAKLDGLDKLVLNLPFKFVVKD